MLIRISGGSPALMVSGPSALSFVFRITNLLSIVETC